MDKDRELGKLVGRNLRCLIMTSSYKTQAAFAAAFGVDVRTVGRWVRFGVYDLCTVSQLARFFGIDVRTLLSE